MNPLVLISSGDADFFLLMGHILEVDGFDAILAHNIEETAEQASGRLPHAVLIDCQPGSPFGVDICTRLKQNPSTASICAIALLGQGAEDQHIDLIKAGIDECFVRPIAPHRVLDFLRNRLAKSTPVYEAQTNRLSFGDLDMNLHTRRVHHGGIEISLGPIEFKILRLLLEHPQQIFSREEMIAAAWPLSQFVDERTVDVHIWRLRRALKLGSGADLIRTVRSAGYGLSAQN
ncbi:response regulator transcription factor (plasmid) [Aliirhizobium terrae]|uniref:response regulator transcription factor n=1 Tax=Terrirhizobium terrae TaxID=2926709 RepID=UPI002575F4AB|nr:response regulator transcription factor [Rhizobium sp. CC-CFT758]WJH38523.1 response regulator transcription factor [Rhizobium sp. CC-CFT758]